MREITYIDALMSLCPGASWWSDGGLEGVRWTDENVSRPSDETILSEIARLEQEQRQNEYKVLREKAYPSVGEQLDALYHAGIFPDDMADKIRAVKEKYPKEF